MRLLLLGAFAGWLLLSATAAPTNDVPSTATHSAGATPEDQEFARLTALDEAAQAEIDKWRAETNQTASKEELERRVRERLEPVGKAYIEFLRRHPNHVQARLSYGCFLNDRQDEVGAQAQWEKALELDPKNADAYNNLAGRYTETGPSRKAFDYFTKAIELKPSEVGYYHNFADALYVLRSHAMTNYGLTEQQVYSRSLLLYSNAARLAPTNSTFAWDFAQTYYAIKPLPHEQALQAWTNALASAHTPADRERIYLQLARVKMLAGRNAEAREQLKAVNGEDTAAAKTNLLRALEQREAEAGPRP